jgi:predicted transcriptional regulator
MPISLRVPPETSARLKSLAKKTGKTQTALIVEALNEKYAPQQSRPQLVRQLAGWMSPAECKALRDALADFDTVDDKDWP